LEKTVEESFAVSGEIGDGFVVEIGAEPGADGFCGAAAVSGEEFGRGGRVVLRAGEFLPDAVMESGGVDDDAVEIEEDRRKWISGSDQWESSDWGLACKR
jgi:hypothetical protein